MTNNNNNGKGLILIETSLDFFQKKLMMMLLSRSGGRTVNVLTVSRVSRTSQGSRLSCLASNNNISAPAATSLVLDVLVLPVMVAISSSSVELVEGRGVSLECVVSGGNPRPSVSWLLDHQRYTTLQYVSQTAIKYRVLQKLKTKH